MKLLLIRKNKIPNLFSALLFLFFIVFSNDAIAQNFENKVQAAQAKTVEIGPIGSTGRSFGNFSKETTGRWRSFLNGVPRSYDLIKSDQWSIYLKETNSDRLVTINLHEEKVLVNNKHANDILKSSAEYTADPIQEFFYYTIPNDGKVHLFDADYFNGEKKTFPIGKHVAFKGLENRVSSFKVSKGLKVTFFNEKGCRSSDPRKATFYEGAYPFNWDLNDQWESMIVERIEKDEPVAYFFQKTSPDNYRYALQSHGHGNYNWQDGNLVCKGCWRYLWVKGDINVELYTGVNFTGTKSDPFDDDSKDKSGTLYDLNDYGFMHNVASYKTFESRIRLTGIDLVSLESNAAPNREPVGTAVELTNANIAAGLTGALKCDIGYQETFQFNFESTTTAGLTVSATSSIEVGVEAVKASFSQSIAVSIQQAFKFGRTEGTSETETKGLTVDLDVPSGCTGTARITGFPRTNTFQIIKTFVRIDENGDDIEGEEFIEEDGIVTIKDFIDFRATGELNAGCDQGQGTSTANSGSSSTSPSSSSATSTNVALGKTAKQSSTFGVHKAHFAVDGNTNDRHTGAGNKYTTTKNDYKSWWEVDLGANYNINQINVFNVTDKYGARLRDLNIKVSATPFTKNEDGVAFASNVYPSPKGEYTGNARGRYVRVYVDRKEYLNLCEVEVLGTPAN